LFREWEKFVSKYNVKNKDYNGLSKLSNDVENMRLDDETKQFFQTKLLEMLTAVLTRSHVPKTINIPKIPVAEWDNRTALYNSVVNDKKAVRLYTKLTNGARKVGNASLFFINGISYQGNGVWLYAPINNFYDGDTISVEFTKYGLPGNKADLLSPKMKLDIAMPKAAKEYASIFTKVIRVQVAPYDRYGVFILATRRVELKGNLSNQFLMEFIACADENEAKNLSDHIGNGGIVSFI
jgi:hypothetical protein